MQLFNKYKLKINYHVNYIQKAALANLRLLLPVKCIEVSMGDCIVLSQSLFHLDPSLDIVQQSSVAQGSIVRC